MKKIMKQLFIRSIAFVTIITMGCIAVSAKILVPFYKTSSNSWEGKFYSAPISEAGAPDNWYEENFDDSSWNTISSPLYLSNGKWQANYYSYWVRCYFTIEELNSSNSFTFYAQHDDGCVAYLNGQEIYNNGIVSDYSSINLSSEAISTLKKGTNVLCVKVSDTGGGDAFMDFGLYENELQDIVARADVPVTITNETTYPWIVSGGEAFNGNSADRYSSSWLTMQYSSTHRTELKFDWYSYNYSQHQPLQLYIDGVNISSTNNSSWNMARFYLDPGSHIIAFRDSIGNYSNSNNRSGVRNISVKEIRPLETVLLTENSEALTFTNNSATPWMIEDGYIEHQNFYKQRTGASFSTTFTIEKTSKLSFDYKVANYNYTNDYNYERSHNLFVYINGIQISKSWNNINDTYWCVALEPGEYTVEWKDTVYNDYSDWINYYSQIKNIELSNNWIDVDLATAGTLGYEVLYSGKANVLTDVEFLKISGPMNAADWTDIKNMTNLLALDLSETQITEIPNNAFKDKSRINSVILPEGLTRIGEYAFQGTNIRRINIPSTVKNIGQYAFSGTPIQYVTFADNSQCTNIANDVFYNCRSLQSVEWGGNTSLTSIGYGAFKNCSSMKEMILPNTVTSVDCAAFEYCNSLQKMHFSDAMTTISEIVCDGCTSLTDLHLPINTTTLLFACFNNTPNLRHVDLPSSVNVIHYRAFDGCGLDSLLLPISLEYLSEESFRYCNNLKYIELPSYLSSDTYSYYYSYGDAGNRRYTTTGYYGYRGIFYSCPAIEKVVMRSATPPSIARDPFDSSRAKSNITLVVPSFSVVNYKLDTYWYQFGTIIEGDDVDYWKLTSPLMLTNNRRMQGTPDVDLYYGGQLTVGGNAPFTMGQFNMYVNESNPGRLLNTCENMSANQVTTKFSVDANKWYFFTPMHDVTVADIQVSNNASYVFRYYDAQNRATNGASGSWKNVDTDKLLAGQGYIFHCNTACTITFPADADGQLQLFRTDDVSRALAVNEATTTANRSWNYVGNPYPCYYDIYYMDFTAPITVWTGSTYKAYSVADDELVLRPMQSFFVQKPDAVDEIVFHKEGRQVTTSIAHAAARNFNRAAATGNRYVFNLAIQHNELQDETRVVINDEAKMGYELERDAAKFMSFDINVPQFFTLDADGNSYAINERPLENGLVRLAYYAGQDGFYTIRALRADGEVTLYDAELNKTVDITSEGYTFQSDATSGVNNSRFTLTFKMSGATSISEELRVKSEESATAPVYNLKGQHVGQSQKGVFIQKGKKVVRK